MFDDFDLNNPDPSLAFTADMLHRVTKLINTAWKAKIGKRTVEIVELMTSDEPFPEDMSPGDILVFSTPDEMKEFSDLAIVAALAAVVRDAPAARAALYRMGLPEVADGLLEQGLRGQGTMAALHAKVEELGVLRDAESGPMIRAVESIINPTVDVAAPDYFPDDAA